MEAYLTELAEEAWATAPAAAAAFMEFAREDQQGKRLFDFEVLPDKMEAPSRLRGGSIFVGRPKKESLCFTTRVVRTLHLPEIGTTPRIARILAGGVIPWDGAKAGDSRAPTVDDLAEALEGSRANIRRSVFVRLAKSEQVDTEASAYDSPSVSAYRAVRALSDQEHAAKIGGQTALHESLFYDAAVASRWLKLVEGCLQLARILKLAQRGALGVSPQVTSLRSFLDAKRWCGAVDAARGAEGAGADSFEELEALEVEYLEQAAVWHGAWATWCTIFGDDHDALDNAAAALPVFRRPGGRNALSGQRPTVAELTRELERLRRLVAETSKSAETARAAEMLQRFGRASETATTTTTTAATTTATATATSVTPAPTPDGADKS